MALSEWLLIGGIGLLLRHGMKKDDSYTYKDSFDMDDEIDFDSDYSYETSAIDASQKSGMGSNAACEVQCRIYI